MMITDPKTHLKKTRNFLIIMSIFIFIGLPLAVYYITDVTNSSRQGIIYIILSIDLLILTLFLPMYRACYVSKTLEQFAVYNALFKFYHLLLKTAFVVGLVAVMLIGYFLGAKLALIVGAVCIAVHFISLLAMLFSINPRRPKIQNIYIKNCIDEAWFKDDRIWELKSVSDIEIKKTFFKDYITTIRAVFKNERDEVEEFFIDVKNDLSDHELTFVKWLYEKQYYYWRRRALFFYP
jgi:hypothetical protein